MEKIYPENRKVYEEYDWDIVLSGVIRVNGIWINELTEDQFLKEIEKDTITLEFFDPT